MKAPIKQKQFRIAKEKGEEWVDNFYILFVSDVPDSVGRENLVPGDLNDVNDLAELHDFIAHEKGAFEIEVFAHSWDDDKPDNRVGINFGTDHKGDVQYFHLPKGSIFNAITLRELCEHHGWDYYDLKEATQSIRYCYDL